MRQFSYTPKDVEAFETDGTRVPWDKLVERLKKRTVVLLTPGGKADPFYLQVIKPGTLILALPPPAIPPPPLAPPTERVPVKP
jgi:hypothetical protein